MSRQVWSGRGFSGLAHFCVTSISTRQIPATCLIRAARPSTLAEKLPFPPSPSLFGGRVWRLAALLCAFTCLDAIGRSFQLDSFSFDAIRTAGLQQAAQCAVHPHVPRANFTDVC